MHRRLGGPQSWSGRGDEKKNSRINHKEVDDMAYTRVYPKVFGQAAWSENCKWYSSLPVGAVVSLFCESV
jgi:hypothetical protein